MYPFMQFPDLQDIYEIHKKNADFIKQLEKDSIKPPKPWGFSIPDWLKIVFMLTVLSPIVGPFMTHLWDWAGWHLTH